MTAESCDVLVVGGGPAGATAAALLAEKGWNVLVLEKECFPRYHVGESLLPYCYFTLERLGLIDRMSDSHFVRKHSVQFVTTKGKISAPFYFFQHFDHPASTTWQVVRSEFDEMLLDNAAAKGAEVQFQMKARELIMEEDKAVGVDAIDADGEMRSFRAAITVDASGRDTFAMRKHKWRVKDPELNKMAVWTYYKGAVREEGLDEGATIVAYLPEKGWFWYIPLPEDTVSVGIVAEAPYLYRDGRDPAKMFAREIRNNPWIEQHLSPGEALGEYWVTGDYSYRSQYCSADGLVLVGDAFSFLDPVFSSGVFLALKSGELAADAIDEALSQGDTSADRFAEYGEELCQGVETMRRLVYAFYNHEFSFRDILMKNPELKGDLTDCLIGNLSRDFGPLFRAIGEFAHLPEPLPHGRALAPTS